MSAKPVKRRAKNPDAVPERPTRWVADVEWMVCRRNMNRMIRSAGLGITEVGLRERAQIVYLPGEHVTVERVQKALDRMVELMNETSAVWEICRPHVISLAEEFY